MKKKIMFSKLALPILMLILILFLIWFLFFDKQIYINLNGNRIEKVKVFSSYEEKGAHAYYKSRLLKGKEIEGIEIINNVNSTVVGEYEADYKVTYNNKVKEATRKIKVIDDENPIIEVSDKLLICPNTAIDDVIIEFKATDNYDGDITNKVIKTVTDNKIHLEVTDSSSNSTVKTIEIERNDFEAPIINLLGDETIYLFKGSQYVEPGYTVIDNCDGDITDKVLVKNNIDINKNGTYKVKYSVTDNLGNNTEVERTVIVYDKSSNIIVPNGSTIYLTFDDGPGAYTGQLLDILKKYDVKATFFVTGQFGYWDYLKRAYDEGHSIGLHTYSHVYKNIYQSVDAYFADLNKIRNKVYDLTGHYSNLVRFPGGSSNTVSRFNPGIMSTLAIELENRGFKYFDWNVASEDTSGISADQIANNIINSLGTGKSYIVLQHDIKLNSIKAVEQVIKYGLSHGYTFASLNETSPTAHHRINN